MNLDKNLIFRMYRMQISGSARKSFVNEGKHNLVVSHQNESGTLSMCASHYDDKGLDNFIFELYQDESHYQIHANSPQFQSFVKVAQQTVVGREVVELKPLFIKTGNDDLVVSDSDDYKVQLLEVTLEEDQIDSFKVWLKNEIHADNVISQYISTKDSEQKQWVIVNVFKNGKANNYGDLKNKYRVETYDLNIDTLVSQPNINFNLLF